MQLKLHALPLPFGLFLRRRISRRRFWRFWCRVFGCVYDLSWPSIITHKAKLDSENGAKDYFFHRRIPFAFRVRQSAGRLAACCMPHGWIGGISEKRKRQQLWLLAYVPCRRTLAYLNTRPLAFQVRRRDRGWKKRDHMLWEMTNSQSLKFIQWIRVLFLAPDLKPWICLGKCSNTDRL